MRSQVFLILILHIGSIHSCSDEISSNWLAVKGPKGRKDVWSVIQSDKAVTTCFKSFPLRPEGLNTEFAACVDVGQLKNCFYSHCQKVIAPWVLDSMLTVFTDDQVSEPCAMLNSAVDMSVFTSIKESIKNLSAQTVGWLMVIGGIANGMTIVHGLYLLCLRIHLYCKDNLAFKLKVVRKETIKVVNAESTMQEPSAPAQPVQNEAATVIQIEKS